MNLDKYTLKSREAILAAQQLAQDYQHQAVEPIHLLLMLYATSPAYAYHRDNYVVIALAPFVLISTMVVLGMWVLQETSGVALLRICG